ncbi:GNAT family N-acetyltransferase [Oenococcus sicerae]|nr:GNAT family N-acetyltransferase [Oenococcus sicerae]QAS69633.2 GNAT family N-acetyltransferase [Oenococcus sicerae]
MSEIKIPELAVFIEKANQLKIQSSLHVADTLAEITQDLQNLSLYQSLFETNERGGLLAAMIVDQYQSGPNLIDEIWGPMTLPYNEPLREHLLQKYLVNKKQHVETMFFFKEQDTWLTEQLIMRKNKLTYENIWRKSLAHAGSMPELPTVRIEHWQETVSSSIYKRVHQLHEMAFHHAKRTMTNLLTNLSYSHSLWLLYDHDIIQSYAIVDIDLDRKNAHLDFIATDTHFLRHHAATQLITAVCYGLHHQQVDYLYLVQSDHAKAAYHLYEKLGFVKLETDVAGSLT